MRARATRTAAAVAGGLSRGAGRLRQCARRWRCAGTRRRLALLVAVCTVACTAGCGAASGEAGGGPVRLSMWARSDQASFMGKVVDGFNRTHRGVHVDLTIIPTQSFVQKLGVAVAGGSGPDLASIDLVYVPFFASSGVLADLSSRIRTLPRLGKLSRSHLRQGEYRGRRYALPFTGDASVLYYNTELFEKAGLDPDRPPRDWHEFAAAARRISALGKGTYGYHFSGRCGGCNLFSLSPFIWASGGKLIGGSGDSEYPSVGTDPTVAQALRMYRTLWRQGAMPPQAAADTGSQSLSLFGSGRVGMYATGAFALSELHRRYPKVKFKVAPIPGRDGGSSSFTGGDDIAVTSNSPHKDAAWRFLRWSVRADVQRRYFGKSGVVPVRTDVALGPYSRRGATYATLGRALARGRTVRSRQENALFNANTSPWSTMISRAVFGSGRGTVRGATADAQADMVNILSRG